MIQDAYLSEENEKKGIVTVADIREVQPDLYIWKGDITRLGVGAIVNAANSGMTGCYQPCHNCIDNCIHTYAGIQLRNYCNHMMIKQGHEEPTGQAKITPAFNLPCDHVIHTVGPIVQGKLTKKHEQLLISCYESCLMIVDENEVKSIAFRKQDSLKTESFIRREIMDCFNVVSLAIRKPMTMKKPSKKWC